ncbi:MAG: alpha/beta fold hydrolase [Ignavibacteriaceae bacterium]|nr:alpha/beta fold hydrolase [Ignavibacteriaceae bacterium]
MTTYRKISIISIIAVFIIIISFQKSIREEYSNLAKITAEASLIDFSFADAEFEPIVFYSDSIKIAGKIFNNPKRIKAPTIIILHGTHVLGKDQPLVLSLAKEFQKKDYNVLIFDFRGYNESEDPKAVNSIDDLNFAEDVVSAINFLKEYPKVDTSKIFILGHSFGAGVSLSAMNQIDCVKKYILFGAPRRVTERIISYSSKDRNQLIYKSINNLQLSYSVDSTILIEGIQKRNIENYISLINQPSFNARFFLIDGSKEDPKDISFYKEMAAKLYPKANYYSIPGSDHYLNTGYFLDRPTYSKQMITHFVNKVDAWLKQT